MGAALLRLLGYCVPRFVFYPGYIWIVLGNRKRGSFGLIAGTVVVKAPK
jgi:uncharacterized RDD family membrane protein YckC